MLPTDLGPDPVEDIPGWLAARFFRALADLQPEDILDVGCGSGRLLRQCMAAGIPARGVEPDPDRVAGLAAQGLPVSVATAENLPYQAGSVDWVCLRHVCHHLAADGPALAEALRVCRSGLVVAEPWLDLDLACQRVARRFDRWLETQSTRCGEIHRLPRRPAELEAALAKVAPDAGLQVRVERHQIRRSRPEGWLRSEAEAFLPLDPDGEAELQSIEAAAAADGLSFNGTAILVVRRR